MLSFPEMTEWKKSVDGGPFMLSSFPSSSLVFALQFYLLLLLLLLLSLSASLTDSASRPVCSIMTHLCLKNPKSADTSTVGLTGRLTSGPSDWLMSH